MSFTKCYSETVRILMVHGIYTCVQWCTGGSVRSSTVVTILTTCWFEWAFDKTVSSTTLCSPASALLVKNTRNQITLVFPSSSTVHFYFRSVRPWDEVQQKMALKCQRFIKNYCHRTFLLIFQLQQQIQFALVLLWLRTKTGDLHSESEHVLHTSTQVETVSCQAFLFSWSEIVGNY